MSRSVTGVSCAYCGSRHDHAAEVRACWERAERQAAVGAGARSEPAPEPDRQASEPDRRAPESHRQAPTPGRQARAPGRQAPEPDRQAAEPSRQQPGRQQGAEASGPVLGPVLGRSVVVGPGEPVPPPWRGCERAGDRLEELEQAWRERVPLVIELGEEPPADEVERRPPWSLSPSFAFPGERRTHAVFANAVDARGGTLRWALGEQAVRLGATALGPADVVLPDGRPAYCDGGPIEWREAFGEAVVVPRIALLGGSLVPFGDNGSDAELAPDQRAAVTHPGGAARIIAPAGSGKTRVLTERARHLLRRWNLPGGVVTLVAYNRRAAEELKDRTPDLPELRIRTLNALGLSLLGRSATATARATASAAGSATLPARGSAKVATIEEHEVRSILDTLVDLPRRANTDPAAAWIEALSAVRLGLQDPARVEADFGGDVDGLPEALDRYRRLLFERGLVDFDEQVYRSIEILLTDPQARRSARSSCRMLLVDEFQDLTPAHLLLIRLLAGPGGAVFGVGDDDQTIYGYSGASPRWLIDYRSFFPTAGDHPLQVNYRCPPAVVGAARTLLTHNRHRVPKRIVAAPGRPAVEGELRVTGGEDPLLATVGAVAALVEAGVAPSDVAVLTRVNASLAPVQVALVHRRVAVRPALDVSYLSRGSVQAALAWLRLAIAAPAALRGAEVALAARRPSRGLSPKVVAWMSEQSSEAALRRLAGRVRDRDADKILGFLADLDLVRRRAVQGTAAAVLSAVRDEIGLDRAMQLLEGARRRLEGSSQTDDLDALVALASLHPELDDFEGWLRGSLGDPGSPDGVVLSTIHRVKGREWPHVVVHDVSARLLPHRLATDVEEERRVFHVALTRGVSSVHVVAGDPPSPFLAELVTEWHEDRRPASGRGASGRVATPGVSAAPQGKPQSKPQGKAAASTRRRGGDRRPRDEDHEVAEPGTEPPPEVLERARQALRSWRSGRAASEGKPPYIYLHDRTLEALARRLPASMAALARVEGIGPAKLEAYGDELLALLAAAQEEADGSGALGRRSR